MRTTRVDRSLSHLYPCHPDGVTDVGRGNEGYVGADGVRLLEYPEINFREVVAEGWC